MSTVLVRDIGPIHSLSIPVPEEGGVVVLQGRNGSGKSHALDAVQSLIGGKGQLSNRDGTTRGEVEGFDARITVGRSTRRSGELDVLTLEGRLDVADLVDPGLKDPAAADARRIKALVRLSGAKADPALFHAALGGKELFERVTTPRALEADDLVEMASRVKRDCESYARQSEAQAEQFAGNAKGLRESADGVDVDAPCDPAALQQSLEAALQADAALRQRAKLVAESRQRAEQAQQQLQDAKGRYTGPTVEAATAAWEASITAYSDAQGRVEALERELSAAKMVATTANSEKNAAARALDQAKQHHTLVAELEATLATAANVEAPTPEQMLAADRAVTEARQAIEAGALVRKARADLTKADEAATEAATWRRQAERLRDAAHGVDDVLSQAVACPVLRVDGGRPLTTTQRGPTFYSELSTGERWKIALDLAAERVGRGGMIVVCQEAYESLDVPNRRLIADHAKALGVVILTAEATDGELSAKVYGEAAGSLPLSDAELDAYDVDDLEDDE